MPLSTSDITFRKSTVMNDTSANGGRMVASVLPSGLKNAIWPDVRQAERTAGSDKWRKVFLHFAPADASQALDVKVVPWAPTTADDRVRVYAGTQSDTQAAISVTPGRAYGVANATVTTLAAGSSTVDVTLEGASDVIFEDGDAVYVTDKADINSVAGAEEYAVIDTVSVTDGVATLTFVSPLANSYAEASGVKIRVASVLALGDVLTSASAGAVTSSAGTFAVANVALLPRSVMSDTWTVTFATATTYAVTGAATGLLAGAGSTATTFSPANADYGGAYFSLPATCWGGTFVAGDTVVFSTAPAARGIWERRTVPAGANSFAANRFTLLVDCESA